MSRKKVSHACDLFFDKGYKQKDAAKEAGVSIGSLYNELHNNRLCHHPHCTEDHPCRAAKRGTNAVMFCGALTDTNFEDYYCPFFKTEHQYYVEYIESTRFE